MFILAALAAIAILLLILLDTFETVVLPRRATGVIRVTSLFYRYTWPPWRAYARRIRSPKRGETFISFYGPMSLLLLFACWALGLVLAFALLQWAAGSAIADVERAIGFRDLLYFSASTFFTLGLGDVRPVGAVSRFLTVAEAGMGFGFLALVIGYLPVIYQAFSLREAEIVLLDARAGSPPSASEFLRREPYERWSELLHDWERWSARLLESHLSYPVLTLFRSQHDNQSWLAALTTVLDVSAFCLVTMDRKCAHQAQLTFAMTRHALADLANVLKTPPRPPANERLSHEEFLHLVDLLKKEGVPLNVSADSERRLQELRSMYEPYATALSRFLLIALPSWIPDKVRDNWLSTAWGPSPTPFVVSEPFRKLPDDEA